jgi:hypothetical protein
VGTGSGGVGGAPADGGVRFLLDENIPAAFAEALRLVGYKTWANREVNLKGADRQSRYLWMQMGRAGYRRREPAELDVLHETPTLLRELIDVHRNAFGYSLADFATWFALYEEEVTSLYGLDASPEEWRRRLRLVCERPGFVAAVARVQPFIR